MVIPSSPGESMCWHQPFGYRTVVASMHAQRPSWVLSISHRVPKSSKMGIPHQYGSGSRRPSRNSQCAQYRVYPVAVRRTWAVAFAVTPLQHVHYTFALRTTRSSNMAVTAAQPSRFCGANTCLESLRPGIQLPKRSVESSRLLSVSHYACVPTATTT